MRIGIFDSGLGGLFLLRTLVRDLPSHTYLYLGDTKRVPYGDRSPATIREYTREGLDALIAKKCDVVIVACNTASTQALPSLQVMYRKTHPHVRLFGMIAPSVAAIRDLHAKRVGILATKSTVDSRAFVHALKTPSALSIHQQAAPLLVPFIEQNLLSLIDPVLKHYLAPLIRHRVDTLLLGCTHYPLIKTRIRRLMGKNVRVLAQDELIVAYLKRELLAVKKPISRAKHPKKPPQLFVTDKTPLYEQRAKQWFGPSAKLRGITLNHKPPRV